MRVDDVHWAVQSLFPLEDMDFIGRFERLQMDFDIVCERIGNIIMIKL
jgi:hypothetical protein